MMESYNQRGVKDGAGLKKEVETQKGMVVRRGSGGGGGGNTGKLMTKNSVEKLVDPL